MAPVLQMIAVIFTAALLPGPTSAYIDDILYAVTLSSELIGGDQETLCVQVYIPMEIPCPVSLTVTLEIPDQKCKLVIVEEGIYHSFHRCYDFQVPTVTSKTVAIVNVVIEGEGKSLNKKTKVHISPPAFIHLVRTNQPIYKPGQNVHFRVLSLDSNFIPVKRKDSNSNRIAQWLDLYNDAGILDFSHGIIPEAEEGTYVINVNTDNGEKISHSFKVEKFVLPKYEVKVHLPPGVSIFDKEMVVKICGKYTYGKPVIASVKAEICRRGYRRWWIPVHEDTKDCKTYILKTDSSGCATQVVKLKEFFFVEHMYTQYFEVTAEMTESATGVTLTGSGQTSVYSVYRSIIFMDLAPAYKPGLTFDGKVKVTGLASKPVPNEMVDLSLNDSPIKTIETDSDGIAKFSLDTANWEKTVNLKAKARVKEGFFEPLPSYLRPALNTAYGRVLEFYSESKSFLKLLPPDEPFPCDKVATVRAEYIIQGKSLKQGQKKLKIYYLVMSKGEFKQQGEVTVKVNKKKGKKGEFSIKIRDVVDLGPYAQVVIYAVLRNGEIVADSMNFPVQLCFKNKVSLKFSSTQELPAEKTKLHLKAAPGSLCSVKAIDLSILLLEKEQDLTVDYMYGRLPVQKLTGYHYKLEDHEENTCYYRPVPFPRPLPDPEPLLIREVGVEPDPEPEPEREREREPEREPEPEPEPEPGPGPEPEPEPERVNRRRRSSRILPYMFYERNDVYSVFKEMGIKIVTNMNVHKPCPKNTAPVPIKQTLEAENIVLAARDDAMAPDAEENQAGGGKKETVRSYFPETWIWDLVSVGSDGSIKIKKKVPDTITKWVAGAFCVSSVGFGVSPNTELTAFQPFFVSLTLPYSVIRGEMFVLRATVFNYLSKCIVVKVKLADSDQYTYKECADCQYEVCLCSEESKTFTWTVTPTALGWMDLKVSAEAQKKGHKELCGEKPTTVPKKGRIDTVIRQLLVEAEGVQQMVSLNALLCPAEGPVEEKMSLKLPEKFVEGSPKASVSVIGDLMGRALKNIDRLLAIPSGCGEQNMLRFAPNVFVYKYLKTTNQLTTEIQNSASSFLEAGYQRELQYKHDDGSFSAFGKRDKSGNTWLTAFVMKSFGMARPFIMVEDRHIDNARNWLSGLQQPDGCIQSVGKLFHNAMKGGVKDEVTLTAYVTAAMLELEVMVTDPVVQKCLGCLKTALAGNVDNMYTTALLSYTFTLAGDEEMRLQLLHELHSKSTLEGGNRHWVRPGASKSRLDSLEVEMTSYVLLALLSGPILPDFNLGYASSIVRWLAGQQNAFGGFSSTQDTVVALQALAMYAAATYSEEGKTTVTVTTPGANDIVFTVDQSNRLLYQEERLSKVPGKYTVKATGKSCVLAQISMTYNILPPDDFATFNISVTTSAMCDIPEPKLTLFAQVSYWGEREETNMVILDIKLLSGYSLDQDSHQLLHEEDTVKHVENKDGHIILYLDGIPREEAVLYGVTLKRDAEISVQNLKPAVVRVYDYYQIGDEAATEYTSPCK
ncbi:alpha-2-macroglobulin-like protein 1 [Xyrichtys novacula]|uniref:Alpha-2-macroglobulin-like protein 1 n=1 Tax=Xyrichtys novacula TaxID=13765 RepID=A0AAV1FXX7_XYRNO|nr:alpha-2-macroglobulin-like protein 1 [Xyrichtys novacula]